MARAAKRGNAARWAFLPRLLPVLLVALALSLSACGSDEEKAGQDQGAEAGKTAQDAGDKKDKGRDRDEGEVLRVYALSEPGPAPSAEELAHAQRVVDYANLADKAFNGLCGRYVDFFKLGLAEYALTFSTLSFGVDKPSATCLKKALAPSRDLLPEEERAKIVKDLETMDALREGMHKDYESLRAYVRDVEVVDDGKKGKAIVGKIEKALSGYADALESYQALVDKAAAEAQDVMLRDHPLRDHVRLATHMISIFRKIAERIALHDPDPGWLDEPFAKLDEEIGTAERLPFPVAGVVEMHYRQFLKAARNLLAVMREGQLESFHPEVRQGINAQWNACRVEYNAFVDALATPRDRDAGDSLGRGSGDGPGNGSGTGSGRGFKSS